MSAPKAGLKTARVIAVAAIAWCLMRQPSTATAQSTPPGPIVGSRAILVTGARSGIGRSITETLAARGFCVYAGARSDADLRTLNSIANVQAIRLDVTQQGDIQAAVATIAASRRGLYGVVNNAGVVVAGPLIELETSELDFIIRVNVYGPYRITQAFAPFLLAENGRVVIISSLNGIVASPMIGAYSMSKHAIEAFGNGLRAELAPLGVGVSLVEPGNYGTEIGRNMLARLDTASRRLTLRPTDAIDGHGDARLRARAAA